MREGVAASKPSEEDEERSNVVPFPERTVDYTGSALKLMAGLAKAAVQLDKAMNDQDRAQLRPEIRRMIERIIETMSVIEEHMDVLDAHSEVIQSFVEPGGNVYFSSDARRIPLEVISFIERRQTNLIVQRLYFRGGTRPIPKLEHDNDCTTLLTHDGCVACKWPRTP